MNTPLPPVRGCEMSAAGPSGRGTSDAGVAVAEPAAEGDPVVDAPGLGSGPDEEPPVHPESRTAVTTQATTPVVRKDPRVRGMSRACRSDAPPDHPTRVTPAPHIGVPSWATST